MSQFKDYSVEGIVPARVTCTVRAMSPEGAKRKAMALAKDPSKATSTDSGWWFSDYGHRTDEVEITGVAEIELPVAQV